MEPRVDIEKIRAYFYNYTVSTDTGTVHYMRQGMRSIAECLHDAALALGPHFRDALIRFQDTDLGVWSIPTMEHDTALLTEVLIGKLVEAGKWEEE